MLSRVGFLGDMVAATCWLHGEIAALRAFGSGSTITSSPAAAPVSRSHIGVTASTHLPPPRAIVPRTYLTRQGGEVNNAVWRMALR